MERDARRSVRGRKAIGHAFLVRSYDAEPARSSSAGYYFAQEEAEQAKRELEVKR